MILTIGFYKFRLGINDNLQICIYLYNKINFSQQILDLENEIPYYKKRQLLVSSNHFLILIDVLFVPIYMTQPIFLTKSYIWKMHFLTVRNDNFLSVKITFQYQLVSFLNLIHVFWTFSFDSV